MNQFTSGIFYDTLTANKAVNAVLAMDYPRDHITVILSSQTRQRFWDAAASEPQMSGAAKIGSSDDVIGSLLARGATSGTEKQSINARDDGHTIIVVGPAASALAGADAHGASRAIDVLNRLGLPRGDAQRLSREIESGGIVIGVDTTNGDRAGVERAMRSIAGQRVMEPATSA